ncbi:MAG: methyltransferase domain-containing protein [Thermoplasmata archaeon]|nr:MAG: methyltransferase domain-containing protein [Thermoplasmata archaeon]
MISENKFIFELSGEHESLPGAEVIACLEAQDVKYRIHEEDSGVLVLTAIEMDINEMKKRLALTHYIDSHVHSCGANEITSFKKALEIKEGSFAVRARRIKRYHEFLDLMKIQEIVAENVIGENTVDLMDPDTEIRAIISGRCHIGIKLVRIHRADYESRKVQFRPYFSPVSLHPRLARTLVNLSRVKKDQNLLDPFCGTGGVLIEAGLIGARPLGSDIDERMVSGCKENLSSLGVENVELFKADISEVKNVVGEVDAIATDPPYGRAASTNREEIFSLYERTFGSFNEIIRPGGYVSVLLPDMELIRLGEKYLSLKESYSMKVHRSLTRHFCVYKKGK